MTGAPGTVDDGWWRTAVLYQVYLRSFADADGDGSGDLAGVIDRLDYLRWLGVDGLWLSPVTVSPDADWGYDVADYCAVHPELGTMEDFDRLVAEASSRGIRILLDVVPNHTSVEHPWFADSRSSRTARRRDWYVWADPAPDGSPPNNWVSSFGGPAWTLDPPTGQYYLHNHLAEQPDLNWWNEEVREAFDDVLRFWWDRGVAGFRIDVCNVIIKDAELRDNPPATEDDDFTSQLFGQRSLYNTNRPEVHGVIARWRQLADGYRPPRVLIGETPLERLEELVVYYGNGSDELHLAFNFPFINAPLEAAAMRAIVEQTEGLLPPGAWPVWTGSNHDMARFTTRWAHDDPAAARAALLMLLCLRGTPVLYQGDEIALGDIAVAHQDMRDPLGVRYWPAYDGRDAMRTPMPWDDRPGRGFTTGDARPWLPIGDAAGGSVAAQRADADSVLAFTRELIALRRRTPELASGGYRSLPTGDGVWAWRRGERVTVAVNLTAGPALVADLHGSVAIATERHRAGEVVAGEVPLGSWEGLVVVDE